nr:unnamed protein product [Digitaria exilis]
MERNPNPGGTKSGVPDGRKDSGGINDDDVGMGSRGILLQRPGFLCLGTVAGVAPTDEPLPASSEAATKPGPCIGSPRVWCSMFDQSRRWEQRSTSAAQRRQRRRRLRRAGGVPTAAGLVMERPRGAMESHEPQDGHPGTDQAQLLQGQLLIVRPSSMIKTAYTYRLGL